MLRLIAAVVVVGSLAGVATSRTPTHPVRGTWYVANCAAPSIVVEQGTHGKVEAWVKHHPGPCWLAWG